MIPTLRKSIVMRISCQGCPRCPAPVIGDRAGVPTANSAARLKRYFDAERPLAEVDNDVDVRVVAATNRDLEKMIEDGTLRHDLYYRLNVFLGPAWGRPAVRELAMWISEVNVRFRGAPVGDLEQRLTLPLVRRTVELDASLDPIDPPRSRFALLTVASTSHLRSGRSIARA